MSDMMCYNKTAETFQSEMEYQMGKKKKELMEILDSCLKETVIECMDDNEVKEKLFNLFCEFMSAYKEDKKEDSQRIEALQSQLAEKDRTIYELTRRVKRAESENEEANQAIIRLRNEKEQLYEKLRDEKSKPKFDEKLAEAYSEYHELPSEVREKYSNMLCGDSPVDFVLKGTKYALELHERICMDWNRLDSETLKSLNKIFDYIFEQFCVINSGYRRLRVEVGEPFDMERHMRTADSSPSGVVREVILCGYEKSNGTRVKSLVKVG